MNAIQYRIGLCVFLVNMEVSIVSTSLVTMTNEFHGFDESTWVITAYLATCTGELNFLALIQENAHLVFAIQWVLNNERMKIPLRTPWIMTFWLLGFLIIWGRLNGVFGRKLTYVATNFIFLAFSAACGAAQSMLQF